MNGLWKATIAATIFLLLALSLVALRGWNSAPTTEPHGDSANNGELSDDGELSGNVKLRQFGPWHEAHLPFSFTYQRQLPPKSKDNVASIPFSDVDELFQSSPGFDQIVELTKQMKLNEVEVTKAIVIEHWSTMDHGYVNIMYYYGIPTVVWFFTIPGDGKGPTYLYFHTLEEAFEIHSLNPIYEGYGNAASDAG